MIVRINALTRHVDLLKNDSSGKATQYKNQVGREARKLTVPMIAKVSRPFVHLTAVVLFLEAAVGIWGFLLHALSNLRGPSIHAFDNFV